MNLKSFLIAISILLLIFSPVLGEQKILKTRNTAWEQLLRENPSAVNDSSISWLDRLILYAVTPDQARDYYEGADPKTIILGNGETLRQYLDRQTVSTGNLYYPLSGPCPLFSLEWQGSTEPMALRARGEDLSDQGGSEVGCGIPEDATAIMLQVQFESDIEIPIRLKLWPRNSPEPAEPLFDFRSRQSDSTMAVVNLNAGAEEGWGDFQLSSSDSSVLEGQVVGYFRRPSPADFWEGSGVSFYTESTDTTYNDAFGYQAGGNLSPSASENSFFGRYAGFGNTMPSANSGSYNSYFGYDAGTANTSAHSNAFFGHNSGKWNQGRNVNAFFGKGAGYSNIGGSSNLVCWASKCGVGRHPPHPVQCLGSGFKNPGVRRNRGNCRCSCSRHHCDPVRFR